MYRYHGDSGLTPFSVASDRRRSQDLGTATPMLREYIDSDGPPEAGARRTLDTE